MVLVEQLGVQLYALMACFRQNCPEWCYADAKSNKQMRLLGILNNEFAADRLELDWVANGQFVECLLKAGVGNSGGKAQLSGVWRRADGKESLGAISIHICVRQIKYPILASTPD